MPFWPLKNAVKTKIHAIKDTVSTKTNKILKKNSVMKERKLF